MNNEDFKKIRKIVPIGGYNEEGNWVGSDGLGVFFEGDERQPDVYDSAEKINDFWGDLAAVYGVDSDSDSIQQFVNDVFDGKVGNIELTPVDVTDKESLDNFFTEMKEANRTADAFAGNPEVDLDDIETDSLGEGEAKVKRSNVATAVASVLAAAAAVGAAGYTAYQYLNQQNVDEADDNLTNNNSDESTIDFDTASFEEIMNAMDDSDERKIVAEAAMELVTTFNEETHKDDNFRLEEDGETYLDLSYEEALILTIFANYSEPSDIYAILGDYSITSEEAQDILESAQEKIITYYMNAKEPSGLANIFFNEDDKAFFENFESEVIEFNVQHDNTTSDQVIRDVYYYYLLNGSTNYTNVSPLAKVLAYDAVYGGLTLTESASTEHTGYLVFQGFQTEDGKFDTEAETKYYVENILNLDYDSLTDEEKETYRTNIIESSTELVKLLKSGETMTEDNSTTEELNTAEVSVEDLVNNQGLCNEAYSELQEVIQSLNTMKSIYAYNTTQSVDLSLARKTLAESLYSEGLDELAEEVEAATGSLSDDLLTRISSASTNGEDLVSSYSKLSNRATMSQIINAANSYLATLENYSVTSTDDIATLINNRRHTIEYTYEADENGYLGVYVDENGVEYNTYSSEKIAEILEEGGQEALDEFIIDNGTVIDEETSTVTEEVSYDELTDEEKAEVEEQKEEIVAEYTVDNTEAAAAKAANSYANSSSYTFSPSTVTNDANGEVYDLNSMTFANGVAYLYAFGNGATVSTSDSQIQAAASSAADSYISSLSSEEQSACQAYYGSSWKSSLKEVYVNAYISQMSSEISTAIDMGKEMRATTDAILEEIAELNAEQENTTSVTETETTEVSTSSATTTSEETETTTKSESTTTTTTTSEVTEGEVEVETNTNTETSTESETSANVDESEDDYDPNIGEQFEEGEVLVEDANGNTVEDTTTATETDANVEEDTNTTETVSVNSATSANVDVEVSDALLDEVVASVIEESVVPEPDASIDDPVVYKK